jgi:hypothetical protein
VNNRQQSVTKKFYLIAAASMFLFSSCLKQSISDAMLHPKGSSGAGGGTASLSYELNGNPVKLTVADAGNQDPNAYTLGCTKSAGTYTFSGLCSTGETNFFFYTDSLAKIKYTYTGNYGDMFFISYNGQDEFVHVASDSLSFTITSYDKGYISGYFSGQLTPLVNASTINNDYGTPGSIKITNGSFQNVPVFY